MVAFYGIKTISYLNVLKNKEMFQLELLFLKSLCLEENLHNFEKCFNQAG